ncbi:hypothetical protein K443DRAFT_3611 [Laccaria amethystina LaAM-08-1]|uniref:Chromatin elongation factor spt5 n=1 Tax=Laccaria amethystina LaAM-08-1 TaxID=1095629 RepID=A0A0C9X167_9AGAR|nr:hypothetical protein K443DRAFT_3611 [Laccaria amethystina LaAM-08-1]
MNEHINHLLKITPGIVCHKTAIIQEQIDFKDWTKLLTMKDVKTNVDVGKWVQVHRGTYKGDIGYVLVLKSWGVHLLLVPCLPLPNLASSTLKRKWSAAAPEPALFDPSTIEHVYGTAAIKQDDGTYKFRGSIFFSDGLIIKDFDFPSISSTSVFMPTSIFFLFQQSHHPTILTARFPCPTEWSFNKGDQVLISSSANGKGIITVTWTELRKHIIVGDFVEVLSRPFQELTGWVDGVNGETVHVIQNTSLKPLRENQCDHIKKFEIHVNWLKCTTLEVLHTPPPSNPDNADLSLAWSNQVPWLGQAILVSKVNHLFKGHEAVVKGVLYGQDTLQLY